MRIVAHLLSVVLLVPGLVIAAAILAIGHVTSQPDFVRLLSAMLDVLIAFFPLAFLALVLWFALALAGFSVRARRAGAVLVAAVAVATSGLIVWATGIGVEWSEAGVHLSNACALVIAIWLASTDWPLQRTAQPMTVVVPASTGIQAPSDRQPPSTHSP